MLSRARPLVARRARHRLLHAARPRKQQQQQFNPAALADALAATAKSASVDQIYHWTSVGLTVAAPVALVLSPSILNWPVDMAVGFIIPVHSHIGMNMVIEDYVPRGPPRQAARVALWIVSFFLFLGLLKVNLCGPGVTESVKSLWRKKKSDE